MTMRRGVNGYLIYGVQAAKGDVVVPGTVLPYVANLSVDPISNVTGVSAAGSRSFVEIEEGMYGVEWSLDFPKVQGNAAALTFMNFSVATGAPEVLPWFSFEYGDDRGTWIVKDCKVDTRTLEGGSGEAEWLTGSMSGFGGLITAGAGSGMAYIDTPGLAMHEAVHSAYELSRFRSTTSNGLKMQPVIAGPATVRTGREWDYMPEGSFTVEGEYGMYNTSGIDLNADCIATWAHVMTWTNKCTPYNGVTLTWAGQKAQRNGLVIPGDDSDIEWTVPWLATGEALAAV